MDLVAIVFSPIASLWLLSATVLGLGSYFTWLEFQRKSSAVVIRIAAVWVALLALLGLITRPSWQSQVPAKPVAILTKGYDQHAVDSLRKLIPELILLETEDASPHPEAIGISTENLPTYGKSIKAVFGEGLPPHAFDAVPDMNFFYRPAAISSGILTVKTEPYSVSHRGIIKGRMKNTHANTKLMLYGPGGPEDSLSFDKPGEASFELRFTPRQSGNFNYQLIASDSSGKKSEMLPLTILPERKLNVLFLQQFPSAEIRYLKNFLADHGHGVVLRYAISRDRYRYEFGNHTAQNVNRITEDLLNDFDLLILNTHDLGSLSAADRKTIEESVRSGLGLIVLLEQVPDAGSLRPLLQLDFAKTSTDTIQVEFNSGKQTMSCLQASITIRKATQIVSASHDKKIISGYQFVGLGKAGFQSLRETYSLTLKDLSEYYAEIWTPLIEQVSRNSELSFKINFERQPPYLANDPLSVEVISSGEEPRLLMDQIPVPLAEDIFTDDLWHGKIWVEKSGWHQLRIKGDSAAFNFYIFSGSERSSTLSLSNQMAINRAHTSNPFDFNFTDTVTETHQISVWIYFAIFLIASAYLWLEPRL